MTGCMKYVAIPAGLQNRQTFMVAALAALDTQALEIANALASPEVEDRADLEDMQGAIPAQRQKLLDALAVVNTELLQYGIVEMSDEEVAEAEARDAEWQAGAYDRALKACLRDRESAYQAEADPLFMQYQRGDIEKQVWLDKIAEIKERFPKPPIE